MERIKKLERRVKDLEAEVARLSAEPKQVFEYHYHQVPAPVYVPQWPYLPGPTWIAGPNSAGATVGIISDGVGGFTDYAGNQLQVS